ncbi:MAG TPA: hypothetical protein VGY55_02320, partial [Pirellulales bacterium]|nr:hypothetical protein [Pirellulales bacterium]
PATKLVAAICLMMVVGVDAAHDAIIDARARAARRLLGSIDHEERVQAVRRQMLNEIRQIAEQ